MDIKKLVKFVTNMCYISISDALSAGCLKRLK
jgi:hypothetical protein